MVSTPAIIQGLLNQGFFDAEKKRKVMHLVIDKVDLSLAMDYREELLDIATLTKDMDIGKVVLTTTVIDESDQVDEDREAFKDLKVRFSGDKKTFLIKVKEDERQLSTFERVAHLFAVVSSTLDKYLLLFNLLKLAIVEGKCAIFVNEMVQAYRIKYFLAKFSIRAFVLSPDMAKNQISSVIHFFHIGQFDVVILMHTGYSKRPTVKDVVNVINFDMPTSFNLYKENGQLVTEEAGGVLTMVEGNALKGLELLQRKLAKKYGRQDMLQCLPLMW